MISTSASQFRAIALISVCLLTASLGTITSAQQPTHLRSAKWTYRARVESRAQYQDLSPRSVTVSESLVDGRKAWVVVMRMQLQTQTATDTVVMDTELRPISRHANIGGTELILAVPDSMAHGLLISGHNVVPLNVPLGNQPFLNYYALRAALAEWPISTGWASNASVLELGGKPRFALVKLTAVGDERLEVPAGTYDCWHLRIVGPGIGEDYWISKTGHDLIRSREPIGDQGAILQLDLATVAPPS